MSPNISALIKPLYPDLENGQDVFNYPNIFGMGRNLYFIDHTYYDETNSAIQSKYNKFEGEFITNLTRYLVSKGNRTQDITILTLYSAQLLHIRELLMYANLKGVKLTNVDSY
jgi:superfamily I DNA and/or RNA helicase